MSDEILLRLININQGLLVSMDKKKKPKRNRSLQMKKWLARPNEKNETLALLNNELLCQNKIACNNFVRMGKGPFQYPLNCIFKDRENRHIHARSHKWKRQVRTRNR